jgi:hypothetical protein
MFGSHIHPQPPGLGLRDRQEEGDLSEIVVYYPYVSNVPSKA